MVSAAVPQFSFPRPGLDKTLPSWMSSSGQEQMIKVSKAAKEWVTANFDPTEKETIRRRGEIVVDGVKMYINSMAGDAGRYFVEIALSDFMILSDAITSILPQVNSAINEVARHRNRYIQLVQVEQEKAELLELMR